MLATYIGLQVPQLAGAPISCVGDPYFNCIDTDRSVEQFAEGMAPYATVSGNRALYTIGADTYGQTLAVATQTAGTIARIRRAMTARANTVWAAFKFFLPTAGSANANDSASIEFVDSATGAIMWAFNPRVDSSVDGSRRPLFTWRNTTAGATTSVQCHSAALPTGVWHQVLVRFVRDVFYVDIINLSTTARITTQVAAAGVAAAVAIDGLQFSSDSGTATPPVSYADVYFVGAAVAARTVLLLHGDADIQNDALFANVQAMLHFENAVDSGPLGLTMTAFGGAAVTGTRGIYGSAKSYENTSSDTSSSFRSAAVLTSTTSHHWTVECKVWLTAYPAAGNRRYVFFVGDSGSNGFGAYVDSAGKLGRDWSGNLAAGVFTVPLNQWVDISVMMALNSVPSTLYFGTVYGNGVVSKNDGSAAHIAIFAAASLCVGTRQFATGADNQWLGSIDEFRLTRERRFFGTANDHKPWGCEFADGVRAAITDSSCANPKPVAAVGSVSAEVATVKFGTKSIYVWNQGSGNTGNAYLNVPVDPDIQFHDRDWTMEAWGQREVSVNSNGGWLFCFSNDEIGWPNYFALRTVGGGAGNVLTLEVKLATTSSGSAGVVYSPCIQSPAGVWNHLSWQRRGTVIEVFLDGFMLLRVPVPGGAGSVFNPGRAGQGGLSVGQSVGNQEQWGGFLDEIRVTRGAARYATLASQTPVAEFPNSVAGDTFFASVTMLLHMNASGPFVDSSSYARTMSNVGAPSLDAVNKVFGAGSLLTPASAGLSTPTAPELSFAAGDFTVECWVRVVGTGTNQTVMDFSNGATGWVLYLDGTARQIYVFDRATGTSKIFSPTQAFTLSTFFWVAISMNSGVATMLIDGVPVSRTHTWAVQATPAGTVRVGTNSGAGNSLINGNIDEVRVTKGVGRYPCRAFTPPSSPFCNGTTSFVPGQAPDTLNCMMPGIVAGASARTRVNAGPAPGRDIGLAKAGTRAFGAGFQVGGSGGLAALDVMPVAEISSLPGLPYTVQYETFDGTGVAGVDYVAQSGLLSFPNATPQTLSFTVMIPNVYDPGKIKTFGVRLKNPIGFSLLAGGSQLMVSVRNDKPAPEFTVTATAAPGNGNLFAEYRWTLDRPFAIAQAMRFGVSELVGSGFLPAGPGMVGLTQLSLDGGATYSSLATGFRSASFSLAAGATSFILRTNTSPQATAGTRAQLDQVITNAVVGSKGSPAFYPVATTWVNLADQTVTANPLNSRPSWTMHADGTLSIATGGIDGQGIWSTPSTVWISSAPVPTALGAAYQIFPSQPTDDGLSGWLPMNRDYTWTNKSPVTGIAVDLAIIIQVRLVETGTVVDTSTVHLVFFQPDPT